MGGTVVQTETVRVIKRMRLLERFSLEGKQSKRRQSEIKETIQMKMETCTVPE